jgi:putative flavoprotein involved in K+ transport
VVVVGAGPSGLATAACLQSRGMTPVVLDRSESVGAVWRNRYDRLHLHTVRWLSGLPDAPIPRAYGRWVARDDFVTYLEAYVLRQRLRPRFGVKVERLERVERDGVGWRLATSDGAVGARRVVLATGYSNVPHLPAWPGRETFAGHLVHSSEYRDTGPYSGKDVLVVGSGNSGAEIAVDLVDGGASQVRLAVRTPPNIVRRDRLGVPSQLIGLALEPLPPSVIDVIGRLLRRATVPDLTRYGLPAPRRGYSQVLNTGTVPILDVGIVDAIRSGRVVVVPGVEGFDQGKVVLTGGARLQPDAIVAATGFRPGLEGLVGHLGVLDQRGIPMVQGPRTSPAAPNLYFVAISTAIGGLIRRAARQANAVARAIAA